MTTPPRWDLSNLYLSLDDPALAADIEAVKQSIQEATQAFETEYLPLLNPATSPEVLNRVLNNYVEEANALELQAGKIFSFLGAIISTDSFNKAAEQLHSRMAIAMLPLHDLSVRINASLCGSTTSWKYALRLMPMPCSPLSLPPSAITTA